MRVCHNCGKSIYLPVHNVTANLSTTGISNSNISTTGHLPTTATSNLLTATPNNLSAAVPVNLSNTPNSNTTTKLTSKRNPKAENDTTKLKIGNDSLPTDPHLLVTPEDATSHNSEANRQPALTNNISPATITNNETLAAIFPFKLEKTTTVLLFSRAALEEKFIMTMYTDVKVNDHPIKLILDSGLAGNIITRQLIDQLGH
ncbi:hypothetical protein G9A89_013954 [Geosiphon pyriformis]|nr:hypothetical protein G9A89_013954 [Geosiphon pyriformis]